MMREGRNPRLLTALAGRGDTRAEVVEALYEELEAVDPERAARIDPRKPGALKWITWALEELAPDGWPFGRNRYGERGFWVQGHGFRPKSSIYASRDGS